jgi:hypothetical protein
MEIQSFVRTVIGENDPTQPNSCFFPPGEYFQRWSLIKIAFGEHDPINIRMKWECTVVGK